MLCLKARYSVDRKYVKETWMNLLCKVSICGRNHNAIITCHDFAEYTAGMSTRCHNYTQRLTSALSFHYSRQTPTS